jgi:glycine C-acetyltransferase
MEPKIISSSRLLKIIKEDLSRLQQAGLYRSEFVLSNIVGNQIQIGGKKLINFASSDFLGLSQNTEVIEAGQKALEEYGSSLANSRLMGSIALHRDLETAIASTYQMQESAVFGNEYLTNLGVFETLFSEEDALFYDSTCHPSMLDGLRLSRCQLFPFFKNDMNDLENKLKRSPRARYRAIVSDTVSAFDGDVLDLSGLTTLAKRYSAAVILDDSLGFGVLGEEGIFKRHPLQKEVDLVSGSLNGALASDGGFVCGHRDIVKWLRHRARPYLFSGALSPTLTASALKALELIKKQNKQLHNLHSNTFYARELLKKQNLKITKGEHPIIAIITHDAVGTQKLCDILFQKGFYVTGFCYPVVSSGFARIRIQISAIHQQADIEKLASTLGEGAQQLGLNRRVSMANSDTSQET